MTHEDFSDIPRNDEGYADRIDSLNNQMGNFLLRLGEVLQTPGDGTDIIELRRISANLIGQPVTGRYLDFNHYYRQDGPNLILETFPLGFTYRTVTGLLGEVQSPTSGELVVPVDPIANAHNDDSQDILAFHRGLPEARMRQPFGLLDQNYDEAVLLPARVFTRKDIKLDLAYMQQASRHALAGREAMTHILHTKGLLPSPEE